MALLTRTKVGALLSKFLRLDDVARYPYRAEAAALLARWKARAKAAAATPPPPPPLPPRTTAAATGENLARPTGGSKRARMALAYTR